MSTSLSICFGARMNVTKRERKGQIYAKIEGLFLLLGTQRNRLKYEKILFIFKPPHHSHLNVFHKKNYPNLDGEILSRV